MMIILILRVINQIIIAIILRKGIGEDNLNYSQTISFPYINYYFSEEELYPLSNYKPASLFFKQDFETPYLPMGFIYKITFNSNYGDPEYIGLNSLEFFDQLGRSVFKEITPKIVSNCVNGKNIDFSDPNNLINQINFNQNHKRYWQVNYSSINKVVNNNLNENTFSNFTDLSSSPKANSIYIMFDIPVCVSCIQFYNLSKYPNQGVKDLQICVDEVLIYKGMLRKANKDSNKATVILFSSDSQITSGIDKNLIVEYQKNKYIVKDTKEVNFI